MFPHTLQLLAELWVSVFFTELDLTSLVQDLHQKYNIDWRTPESAEYAQKFVNYIESHLTPLVYIEPKLMDIARSELEPISKNAH
jgi:hypothetical protein